MCCCPRWGWQAFQRNSSIYFHPNVSNGHAQQIGGLIRDKWGDLGYENSPLRYPTTRELGARKPGRFNRFEGGNLYWSSATGAHPVYGEILKKWGTYDYENGRLGFPTTDEISIKDNGKYQGYEGGNLYFSPAAGTHLVWGSIREEYDNADSENGKYGYPSSDPRASGCGEEVQDFQGGVLVSNVSTYVLGHSAVDGRRLAYTANSSYTSEVAAAISAWNALGQIDIRPVGVFEGNDVAVSDVNRPDVTWSGQSTYKPGPGFTDTIEINHHFTDNLNSDQVRGVITHEFGHALGESDIDCPNELMANNDGLRGTAYSPQALATDVYNYLWK